VAPPVTVNLTRIYTKLGDGGETHLGDMSRVPKTHPRIEAYGAIDELNAQIGVTLTVEGLPEAYVEWLRRIQNDLFDVGADLSVPLDTDRGHGKSRLRITDAHVTALEQACDDLGPRLEPLTSFVLSGGTPQAAALHLARTTCRRAERHAVALGESDQVNPAALAYLNRLSDLLFIAARLANDEGRADVLWQPGGSVTDQ
jgi:cob(I)alamin adenosyltransferase